MIDLNYLKKIKRINTDDKRNFKFGFLSSNRPGGKGDDDARAATLILQGALDEIFRTA